MSISRQARHRTYTNYKLPITRSISDASWYSLTQKIEYLAAKQGKVFKRVNPHHTSQRCPECGHTDKSNRNKEKFICGECGYFAHADLNAARNIKQRGIEKYGFPVACKLKAHKVKIKMVRQDLSEPEQLSLFKMPISELTQSKSSTTLGLTSSVVEV